MKTLAIFFVSVLAVVALVAQVGQPPVQPVAPQPPPQKKALPPPIQPTAEDKRQVQAKVDELDGIVRALKSKRADAGPGGGYRDLLQRNREAVAPSFPRTSSPRTASTMR